jgi:predicted HTH transcriptional regulator
MRNYVARQESSSRQPWFVGQNRPIRLRATRRKSGGKFTKISHDTALRDIQDLISKGILKQDECGGRSTANVLVREHRVDE